MLEVIKTINSYLADYILVILLVGVGIFFTVKTKFVQIRCFGEGMKNVFGKVNLKGGKQKGGMSSFQAFTAAVAAQVGTGNIIGASSAILIGGPGAIFWMWIIAFFGMATIYSEAVLAQKTREVREDGSVAGGPVYYIKKAFNNGFGKFLAGFFAVAIIIALGFIGTMVQSNSISVAISQATDFVFPTWAVGIIIAVLCVIIFLGGVSRLASVTEKIVPIMAIVYLLGCFIIICFRITAIPEAFLMILKFAFTPQAVVGGGIGVALKKAVSMGAKRGLFSNEAGMGSTPHAHALANVKTPHQQGTVAMVSVFIDTFVVLTMTALVVISTLYAGGGVVGQISQEAIKNGQSVGEALAQNDINANNLLSFGISTLFDNPNLGLRIGYIFVAICLAFFAFSTIISWNLFGKINFEYLFGKKSVIVYSVLSVGFVLLGSFLQNDLVWELSDFFNYLMVIPNVIAILALSGWVSKELKENGRKKKLHTITDDGEKSVELVDNKDFIPKSQEWIDKNDDDRQEK